MAIDPKVPTSAAIAKGEPAPSGIEPIIIDMGKKNRKQVRKLTKGKSGRLMDRLEETIEHLRENGSVAPGVQPVVIVIRQKPKRKGRRVAKAWGLG